MDTVGAEPDDIGHAVAVHVGELARIKGVVRPAAGTASEIRKLKGRWPEGAAPGGERYINTALAEADNVGHVVAIDVGQEARKIVVIGPASGAGSKIRQL